jgi:hypothetical protein
MFSGGFVKFNNTSLKKVLETQPHAT